MEIFPKRSARQKTAETAMRAIFVRMTKKDMAEKYDAPGNVALVVAQPVSTMEACFTPSVDRVWCGDLPLSS
ncbi:MAG: hypothetical protein JSS11_07290 [Verrucomicrobia bacterium]|nr:hypothetical protein [Verrucomicrobiota bacterium]